MSDSVAYWARRAEADMGATQEQANRRLKTIGSAVSRSQAYLMQESRRIFKRYQTRFGLTGKEAEAYLKEPITRAEYNALLRAISGMPEGAQKRELEARASRGAYAYRISRAESLSMNIAAETAKVAQVVEDETTGQLRLTAVDMYARGAFSIQQRTRDAFSVPNIDAMRVAIDTPWSGKSYSEAIWGDHRETLARTLEGKITEGFLSGKSYSKTAAEIRDRFGVTYGRAKTLVRTETSYVANQAAKKSQEDAGLEEYMYATALDEKVCWTCGPLDREIFRLKDAKTGENHPPMHPRCRCSTLGVVKREWLLQGLRRGRGKDSKNVLLPRDINFMEWKQWQRAGAPEDVRQWLDNFRASRPKGSYTATRWMEEDGHYIRLVEKDFSIQ